MIIKIFKAEWKRILYNPLYILAVAGTMLLCLLSRIEQIGEAFFNGAAYGYHNQLLLEALSSSMVLFAIPIFCTFPASTSILDDFSSGFIKQYLSRTKRRSYLAGKIISSITAGGSVLVFGAFLAWIIFLILLKPNQLALEAGEISTDYFAQILSSFGLLFLNGSLWSIWGILLACITKSRYMAYSGSFVTYYLLIILHERYFKDIYLFYPVEWLNPTMDWHLGGMSLPLLLIFFIIIISLFFWKYMERRVKDV